ncbi:MAG: exodeoxyribonuclease VII large subunit [Candidatus Izimaplasma sp.]|nr:exodeoxyribonuclease VII large subunit [Candidatus Izimaplasma bacterium]
MDKQYLTVTALTKYIKYKFDNDAHLKNVLLKGEISNFKHHSRGHFYLTLKDDNAQISAIMFASNSKKVKFKPEDGMSVTVEGYLSVYERTGQYQIYITKMNETGLGNLYVAFEQLKKDLEKEGLFDQRHKKQIPSFPKNIAVLTSPTGAAVRDIIHTVNRRFPLTQITVYPTLVQGEYAKDNIVEQIKKVNANNRCDVIILGRGGGSIEDLWPFNEEIVAREIFSSNIPIISSVGHETDFTISDFVADLRAPTPTGGAEIAVPSKEELFKYLKTLNTQSDNALKRLLKNRKRSFKKVRDSIIFHDPMRITEAMSNKLDYLTQKLKILAPIARIEQAKKDLVSLDKQLGNTYQDILNQKTNQFKYILNTLKHVNPLNIMEKGYSLTKKEGKIIKSINDITQGDLVDVNLKDGAFKAEVKSLRKETEDE